MVASARMTTESIDLASQTAFSGNWSEGAADEELRRWSAFLGDHGVTWSAGPKDRELVLQMLRSAPDRAGELIELRLSKLANDVLKQSGDARRVCKQITSEPTRRWYVLSPERRSALERSGLRFESGMEAPLRQLATIPITLGVYFAAHYACTAAGVDANVAWVIALVAYVLTVRVVRGRWPLTRS
jgi:hypothetical protein